MATMKFDDDIEISVCIDNAEGILKTPNSITRRFITSDIAHLKVIRAMLLFSDNGITIDHKDFSIMGKYR